MIHLIKPRFNGLAFKGLEASMSFPFEQHSFISIVAMDKYKYKSININIIIHSFLKEPSSRAESKSFLFSDF